MLGLGYVTGALSTVTGYGQWGLRQLVHAVEVNRSGPWVYPQLLSKVAALGAGLLAYHAHTSGSNDLKNAYIACSVVSLVASYAFRQIFLSNEATAAAQATAKKAYDTLLADKRIVDTELTTTRQALAQAAVPYIGSEGSLTKANAELVALKQQLDNMTAEKNKLAAQLQRTQQLAPAPADSRNDAEADAAPSTPPRQQRGLLAASAIGAARMFFGDEVAVVVDNVLTPTRKLNDKAPQGANLDGSDSSQIDGGSGLYD